MASTHQITGEVITCKCCNNPAEKFVQGLWPLCDKHVTIYLNTEGDTVLDRLSKMKGKHNV